MFSTGLLLIFIFGGIALPEAHEEEAPYAYSTLRTSTFASRPANIYTSVPLMWERRLADSNVTSTEDDDGDDGDDTGIVIGIVLGILCAVLVLILILVFASKYRKQKTQHEFKKILELEGREEVYEEQVRLLKDRVQAYELRRDARVVKSEGPEKLFWENWEKFCSDDVAHVETYTKHFNMRSGRLQMRSSGAWQNFWPDKPATSPKDVSTMWMSQNKLKTRLSALAEKFQKMWMEVATEQEKMELKTDTIFPELIGQGLDPRVYVDGNLEEEIRLLEPMVHPLLRKVKVQPYGVLGVSETKPNPKPGTPIDAVVVDNSPWTFIGQRNTPSLCKTTTSCAAIYDWLGIRQQKFPPAVHDYFGAPCELDAAKRAKYYCYSEGQHVIHVISPRIDSCVAAMDSLSHTYYNVLVEFYRSIESVNNAANGHKPLKTPKTLRLVPLSTGLYVEEKMLEQHMPLITWSALSLALAMLPHVIQERMNALVIELCVYKKQDMGSYEKSLSKKLSLVGANARFPEAPAKASCKNSSHDWIRKQNGPLDRLERLLVTTNTQMVVYSGGYVLNGKTVTLAPLREMLLKTRIKLSSELPGMNLPKQANKTTKVTIIPGQNRTAMEVAAECQASGRKTVAVNAASAYSVGGGCLTGGRHALEESWCSVSTLLKSLQKVHWETLMDTTDGKPIQVGENEFPMHVPTKGCIVSPGVEIFRNVSSEGYSFQTMPTRLEGVCSVAMFNMNSRVRDSPLDAPQDFDEYCSIVKQKFAVVLHSAIEMHADVLVFPDVGCGVFENDPVVMGTLLGEVLCTVEGHISEVVLMGKAAFSEAAERAFHGEQVKLEKPMFFRTRSGDYGKGRGGKGGASAGGRNAAMNNPPADRRAPSDGRTPPDRLDRRNSPDGRFSPGVPPSAQSTPNMPSSPPGQDAPTARRPGDDPNYPSGGVGGRSSPDPNATKKADVGRNGKGSSGDKRAPGKAGGGKGGGGSR